MPGLTAAAEAFLVLLGDEDSLHSEQNDVFVTEHGPSASSAAGNPSP